MTELECGKYNEELSQLFPLLQKDSGAFWTGLAQNLDWILVEPKTEDLKIKVIHPEKKLFVKVFSKYAKGYPQVARNALFELAQLELKIPILAPLELCNDALIFELGESSRDAVYQSIYDWNERKAIEAVLVKHNLVPLYGLMKIGVIAINGQNFSVDPFQDDINSIFDFVNED